MNDQTANIYFDDLIKILTQQKLDWVVEQVSEQIRLGKIEEKEIIPYKETIERISAISINRGTYRMSKKEKFQVVVPYSAQEKLSLLISAIQKLFVESSDMQISVADSLISDEEHIKSIRYIGEESEEPIFIISPGEIIKATREHSNRLNKLLEQLKSEVGEHGDQ